jgi:hypothetical protein
MKAGPNFPWERTTPGPGGCMLWTGCRFKDGYGQIRRFGRNLRAHRFSYEKSFGPIGDSLCVLHRCDVPACVNPEHLFLGTNQENMDDKVAKGRACNRRRGETNSDAKLTSADVRFIRSAVSGGITLRRIADAYQMSHQHISDIVTGKRWAYLEAS